MKKRFGSVLVAVCVAGSFCLASLAMAETAKPVSGTVASAAVQVTSTVVEIDHKKREVTLKAADGREETFIVNREGGVLQKDLGTETGKAAQLITVYDPDKTWEPAGD